MSLNEVTAEEAEVLRTIKKLPPHKRSKDGIGAYLDLTDNKVKSLLKRLIIKEFVVENISPMTQKRFYEIAKRRVSIEEIEAEIKEAGL